MAWTYDLTDLSTPLNQVRFNIGQVDEFSPVALQDEEIAFVLLGTGNDINQTSIQCIDAMIMRATALVNRTTGMVSESLSDLLDNLKTQKEEFIKNTVGYSVVATGLFDDDFHEGQQNPDFFHSGSRACDEGPLDSNDIAITVTQTADGSITPEGDANLSVFVREFTDQDFVITPDSLFKIDTITVDSVAVAITAADGASQTYTFTVVKETHTITATFVLI